MKSPAIPCSFLFALLLGSCGYIDVQCKIPNTEIRSNMIPIPVYAGIK